MLLIPFANPIGPNSGPLSDGIIFGAVSTPMQGDDQIPMEKKLKQYQLLQKVNAGGEADLTAEEIALIKERAAKLYPILVFGRLIDLLEGEPLKAVKPDAA